MNRNTLYNMPYFIWRNIMKSFKCKKLTARLRNTRFWRWCLNNPARRVGRGFQTSRQDFSQRAVLESRFSPALRFSRLLRHLSVLRKTGTWLLWCRPSTPTLYHTIDTHPESGNKRAGGSVTNLYCYRVTLIIDWQITHCCKFLYLFATFVIRCIRHIPYFHFSG